MIFFAISTFEKKGALPYMKRSYASSSIVFVSKESSQNNCEKLFNWRFIFSH